jgi:cytochrome b subunit of formate dehydrogenase
MQNDAHPPLISVNPWQFPLVGGRGWPKLAWWNLLALHAAVGEMSADEGVSLPTAGRFQVIFSNFMKPQAILLLSAMVLLPCMARTTNGKIANDKCLECHSDKDLTKELPDGKKVSMFTDEAKQKASVHGKNQCADCHKDLTADHPDDEKAAKPVDCASCHEKQSKSFGASVHGIALHKGNDTVAHCKDCHGTHEVFPRISPRSTIHITNLVRTCGQCHGQEADDVTASVHGQAILKGKGEAATCIDCHAEHQIVGLRNPAASFQTAEACSKCHASERINSRFGMPNDRVKTFFESYHGLAATGGSTTAANCASCHGYHKILRSSDPDSMIHPTHLMETCGKCHPGASASFVGGKIHVDEDQSGETGMVVNRWVKKIYIILIVLTVVLLGLHNGVAWWRKVVARRRANGEMVMRMDRGQRMQHFVLMSGFVVLAVTGFALKFPNTWFAHLMGSEEIRRWIHRVAGLVLIAGGIYHICYVIFTATGRKLVGDLWPRWRDARDVVTNVNHLVFGKPKARFGRFGYPEKIEYWAVVWGTVVMGVTGVAIWCKIDVTRWLPRWIVEVAITIHYYEAILACLAIIIWHFYHVMFDPDVYPMNWAWLDGKVSKKWHDEEHPLEAETEAERESPDLPGKES